METVYFNGIECHTAGLLPAVGTPAPAFTLTGINLQDVTNAEYQGKNIVLNIFPSLDTEVCAMSVRRFNTEAAKLKDTVIICVAMDLPFAMSRFCTINGIDGVVPASAFRSPEFCKDYGVMLVDGPLKGLLTRAVIIIDKEGNIAYRDLVHDITHEPDYEGALRVLNAEK